MDLQDTLTPEDEEQINEILTPIRQGVALYLLMHVDGMNDEQQRVTNRNAAVAIACLLGEFTGKSLPSRTIRHRIIDELATVAKDQSDSMALECFAPATSEELH